MLWLINKTFFDQQVGNDLRRYDSIQKIPAGKRR